MSDLGDAEKPTSQSLTVGDHVPHRTESRLDRSSTTSSASSYKEQMTTPSDLESNKEDTNLETEARDPDLVTWDGPNDPANPKGWSFKRRWLATGLVSLITFMTPIASSMIAPAALAIDHDLHVHEMIESELIFSIFLLAFVIGPLFLAPLSEVYGRVIILQLSCAWFLVFNLVCGFAKTAAELLVFRFLAGLGACAPQTIGGGVLSDLWTSEERGVAVAVYTLAPVLSPALGPLIGAWITQETTWRWSFWATTIFGVVVQILIHFTLSETYAPRILHQKAEKMRKESGNEKLHTEYEEADRSFRHVMRHSLTRVFVLLGTQPIVQFLSLYWALIYGVIYLMLASFPSVWTDIYHESIGIGGLNYISLMIGLTAGAQASGRLIDWSYRQLKSRAPNGEGRPEFRIPILFVSTFLVGGGLLMFGWSVQAHTHWIVPNIGAVIFGAGSTMTFTALQTYTIDSYQLYAASAVGATAVARALMGFSFPLFGPYMFDAVGQGWGNTITGVSALVIGYSGSLVLWFYGERLRKSSNYAADK